MEIVSKLIHSPGRCSMSVAGSSGEIYTVGGDSRVVKHIYQKEKVESSEVANLNYEPVHCVSSKTRKRCYIACADNVIRAYELDSFEFVEVIMKTTQPIQWLAISHDSAYLAVATKDSKIDIVKIDSRETTNTLLGHQGGVNNVQFSPSDRFLSSIGADGTLRIWDISQSKCLSAKPYIDKEFVSCVCSSWCDMESLVVPYGTKLDIIQSSSWISQTTLSSKFGSRVELVAFSPNGLYVAYLTCHDDVYYLCVMDVRASAEIFQKSLEPTEFNSLTWDEDGRAVKILSKEVILYRYEVIASNLISGTQSLAHETPVSEPPMASIQVDEDSEDDIVVRRHIRRVKPEQPDDEETTKQELDENDNDNEEEEGIPTEEPAMPYITPAEQVTWHHMFMPAASEEVQNRCFLAYNEVGLIVKRSEGSESVIEVEFTDNTRKRVLFRDASDVVVGSLSNEGVVVGGVMEEEGGRFTGVVLYRPFHSWTARASWRIELPSNEIPDLIACTDSAVFVYTSKGFLRSWHVSGIQRSIYTPCNHVVSMVGSRNTLALVYEDAAPLDHSHNLKVLLYATSPFRRLYQGPLPISPHATLSWIGFTKEGLLATYDSQCVIRLFTSSEVSTDCVGIEDMEWVVLMNLRHIMKERCAAGEAIPYCWLVALSTSSIKYIYLPSAEVPVPTLPRPLLAVMDVDIPLCNKSNAAYSHEKATLLKSYEISAKSLSEEWEEEQAGLLMEFDKMLLRQMNVELGSNQLVKAEYLCSLIHSVVALKKAAILAQKVESSTLVDRIEKMIENKTEEEMEPVETHRAAKPSFESRIQQTEMKRSAGTEQYNSKRIELDRPPEPRPYNAFKRTLESPQKKSLLGQIKSVVSPLKKSE